MRRGALLTLNCLANNRPAAIRDALSIDLLPMLYSETEKKPELVHQANGPFSQEKEAGACIGHTRRALPPSVPGARTHTQ